MRFVGRGHPAIRASHDKTLELTTEAEITARATCVVAVGAFPDPPVPLAGPVRITVSAGGERFTLRARANPGWDPSGPTVIRRSPFRLPGTFATHADAAAADLPQALVAALADVDAVVTVEVEPVPDERTTTVLAWVPPAARELPADVQAEAGRAGTVLAQDAGARRLVEPVTDPAADRILVVATASLPRPPDDAPAAVEVLGLPDPLAAAVAARGGGPVVVAGAADDTRTVLRSTPAGARVVLPCAADRLVDLLGQAAEIRGGAGGVAVQPFAPPVRLEAGLTLASREAAWVGLDAVAGSAALDPAVLAAVTDLLAGGVATKAAARALATLTGWDRRRAYAAVLDWPPTA